MEKLSDAQLDEAFETLRGAVLARPGATEVLTQLNEETNPRPDLYKDRPAVWRPSVTLSATPATFGINSVDQYKWGHPKTGQRFPLPELPLERGTLAEEAIRSVTWTPGFPSEGLKVSRAMDGTLNINSYGPHGQFDYEALLTREAISRIRESYPGANPLVGSGVVRMDRQQALWLRKDYRVDLEAQLVEGTFALGADLLDKAVDPESPVAWPALIQDIRGRVELRRQSMLNDNDPRGDLIPQGEQLLYLASRL